MKHRTKEGCQNREEPETVSRGFHEFKSPFRFPSIHLDQDKTFRVHRAAIYPRYFKPGIRLEAAIAAMPARLNPSFLTVASTRRKEVDRSVSVRSRKGSSNEKGTDERAKRVGISRKGVVGYRILFCAGRPRTDWKPSRTRDQYASNTSGPWISREGELSWILWLPWFWSEWNVIVRRIWCALSCVFYLIQNDGFIIDGTEKGLKRKMFGCLW